MRASAPSDDRASPLELPAHRSMRRALARSLPTIAAALPLIAIIAFVHRNSPRTLLSAHGFLHSAIAMRFFHDFHVPPENPFFAGKPLGYYWFFHALGALVAWLVRTDPLHAFELLVFVAAFGMARAASAFAERQYGSPWLAPLIVLLVVGGANVQAPAVLAVRLAQYGPGILRDSSDYLWGIVHPLLGYMRVWDPYAMYGPLIRFFLNTTARPLALACVVVVVAALARALTERGVRPFVWLACATALCTACSVLTGAATAGGLGAAMLALFVAGRMRRFAGVAPAFGFERVVWVNVALVAGLAASSPTYAHLFAVGAGGSGLLPAGAAGAAKTLAALLAASAVLAVVAGYGLTRLRGSRRDLAVILCLAAAILVVAAATVGLPEGNQDNFFDAALVLLALVAPAAALGADGTPSLRRAMILGFVCVPGLALVVACYIGRPPLPLGFEQERLVRTSDDARSALYAFARNQTPANAVFVVDTELDRTAMAGNTAELPALTDRMLFNERAQHYIVAHYRDLAQRIRINRVLRAGDALSVQDREYLQALARPLFVVVEGHGGPKDDARLRARYGKPVFVRAPLRVYRVDPARLGAVR